MKDPKLRKALSLICRTLTLQNIPAYTTVNSAIEELESLRREVKQLRKQLGKDKS